MADEGGGREVLGDVILTHRGRRVAPKTRNQKAYTDAIREHQIVFGIGPAGTGQTYLAVAVAGGAFNKGEAAQVILAQPAVGAGGSPGFLPRPAVGEGEAHIPALYTRHY